MTPAEQLPRPRPIDEIEPEFDRSLRRFALRLVRDAADADDIVQDAWLVRLASSREHRDPDEQQQSGKWMFGVVRNLSRKHQSLSDRRRELEALVQPKDEAPAADEAYLRASTFELLRSLLESLREPYRSTLKRRYLEERTVEEIARADAVSVDTVKSRDRRGRLELRALLDRECDGEREEWVGALLFLCREAPATSLGSEPSQGGLHNNASKAARTSTTWKVLLVASAVLLATAGAFVLDAFDPAPNPDHRLQRAGTPSPVAALSPRAAAPVGSRSSRDTGLGLPAVAAKTLQDIAPSLGGSLETRTLELFIKDAAGLPVPYPLVQLQLEGGRSQSEFKGDRHGIARINVQPHELRPFPVGPGPDRGVFVSARASAGAWSPLYKVPLPREGRSLELTVGEAGQSLVGVVRDPSGRSISGAQIGLLRETSGEQFTQAGVAFAERGHVATTDAEGHFRFVGLPRRLHRFEVTKQGLVTQRGLIEGDDEELRLDLTLAEGLTLRGQVTLANGLPARGAQIWEGVFSVLPSDESPRFIAGDDGRFELSGLAPGEHRFFAQDQTDSALSAELVLTMTEDTSSDWSPRLQRVDPLRVLVLDASGEPVDSASVAVLCVDHGPEWGQLIETDRNGRATLAVVPRGTISVNARWTESKSFTINVRGSSQHDGELVLREPAGEQTPGALEGTLHDHNGVPFGNAMLIGCAQGDLFKLPVNPVTGAVRTGGRRPGSYRLLVVVPGKGAFGLGEILVPSGGVGDFGAQRSPQPVAFDLGDLGLGTISRGVLGIPGPCGEKVIVQSLTAPQVPVKLFPGRYLLWSLDKPGEVTLSFEVGVSGDVKRSPTQNF